MWRHEQKFFHIASYSSLFYKKIYWHHADSLYHNYSSWCGYGYRQQCLHKWIQIHNLRNDSTITESKSNLCAVWTQALFRSLLLVVITIITRGQVADFTVLTSSEPDICFYVSMESHRNNAKWIQALLLMTKYLITMLIHHKNKERRKLLIL